MVTPVVTAPPTDGVPPLPSLPPLPEASTAPVLTPTATAGTATDALPDACEPNDTRTTACPLEVDAVNGPSVGSDNDRPVVGHTALKLQEERFPVRLPGAFGRGTHDVPGHRDSTAPDQHMDGQDGETDSRKSDSRKAQG